MSSKMIHDGCCIGTNKRKLQLSVPLLRITNRHGEGTTEIHLELLEQIVDRYLDWKDDSECEDDDHFEAFCPVKLMKSEDGLLLNCVQPDVPVDENRTIFGIQENQKVFQEVSSSNPLVSLECYSLDVSNLKNDIGGECKLCRHPKFEWSRHACHLRHTHRPLSNLPKVKIFDFSQMQSWRRVYCERDETFPSLDSPASVCHLLRSVLKCDVTSYVSSCVSPWKSFCTPIDASGSNFYEDSSCDNHDQVIAILLSNQLGCAKESSSAWDVLEENELKEITKFRTGDACPNYYLYSISKLQDSFQLRSLLGLDFVENSTYRRTTNGYTLLVYRHLTKRLHFKNDESALTGGLLEYTENGSTSGAIGQNFVWRMTAPPYQDVSKTYGDLLDSLTLPENLRNIAREANRIQHWTAWPEKNHYQFNVDHSDEEKEISLHPASWTVFPLCHTFPADDASAKKWIESTCSTVPHTVRLLRQLGPLLRTALFSRLEPRTVLGAHTGWADLANYVFRIHIPLCVPCGGSNEGMCGTWVDGVVETHENGKIISFDDSKTHRAFNYSEQERIVLIIDLARPKDLFPMGTSTGGHTDELNSFINQFT